VYNLTIWQFENLYFNNSLLNCTNVTEGPFLKSGGPTSFTYTIDNEGNGTHGTIQAGCFLIGSGTTASGSGTLATLTFTALAEGNTNLHPENVYLQDNSSPSQTINHTDTDGTVHVVVPYHEIATTSLVSYKTIVGKGYVNNLTVTVQNQGFFTETFNVTVYSDSTQIGRIETTLDIGESAKYIIQWNTTLWAYGSYEMRAYASPVAGETNTTNNTCNGDFVAVLKPGDVKEDYGKIDMKDVSYVARRFLINTADPLWDSKADINSDGKVDMKDIAITAKNFGLPY
jgi:hypothetical protein